MKLHLLFQLSKCYANKKNDFCVLYNKIYRYNLLDKFLVLSIAQLVSGMPSNVSVFPHTLSLLR